MLEEFDDLISTICANSSIMHEERDGRLFFTNDGLIFDSFWELNDYFKFGRSERPSFGGGYLWTRNPTIAQYQLVVVLGSSIRRLNSWDPIALPSQPDTLENAWSLTPVPGTTAIECVYVDDPELSFGTFTKDQWLRLASLLTMPLEDVIRLYTTK